MWALAQQTSKVFGLWGWGWNDKKNQEMLALSIWNIMVLTIFRLHDYSLHNFTFSWTWSGAFWVQIVFHNGIGWLDKETIRVCCALFFKCRRSLWGHAWCHKNFIVITFKGICMMNLILLKTFFVIWPLDLVVASEDRSDNYVSPCIIN